MLCAKITLYRSNVQFFLIHIYKTLTWVAVVEIVVIFTVVRMVPLPCVCLFVILHQHPKEDDEDDLQDEAGDRQF